MRAVVAAAEVVTAVADAATKPDRLRTAQVVRAGARRHGVLREPLSQSRPAAMWLRRRPSPSPAANLRTHTDQVPHSCRPRSALVLNRFYLFYSFCSSSFLLLSTYGVPLAAPSVCTIEARLSVGVHPRFLPPDSGSWWQAAPWSPRRLIGLLSAQKPSPARGISTPATTPASPLRSRPSRSRRRSRTRLPGRPRSPLIGRTRSRRGSAC